jgi:pimeloyl-ACP methyl ester carboxylesterase
MLIGLERSLGGLHRKSVQVGDHRIVYSEGGRKHAEILVLVHGFNGSADSWNRMAGKFTRRYHVIAPDLPGWGASTRIDSASYGYPAQVDRLHQFLAQLGIRRFHLMGHSMGGGISARYAAEHADEVITLGLMAPHGMVEPQQSELARCIEKGDNWLVVSSRPGFDRLMNNLFVKRPFIPGTVLKYLAQVMAGGSSKTDEIFAEIQKNEPPLAEQLTKIKAPVFIIWGDQDKLVHVSAAELFRKGIANSETLILKHTGHMPLMENMKQCSTAYLAFLEKRRATKEAAA